METFHCEACENDFALNGDIDYHECRESGEVHCIPCYDALRAEAMADALGGYVRAPTPADHDVRCMLCGDHGHGTNAHPWMLQ